MKKTMLNSLACACLGITIIASSLFSISSAWGSTKFSFSAINIMLPLLGAFFGLGQSLALAGLFFLGKIAAGKLVTFGIPTLCATASMASHESKKLNFALHILVPLACMALFVAHPVGRIAFVYSWYWFIPMALYVINAQSLFTRALQSTFTAHAVGSIIWLYSMPMKASQWIGLLPVVALERFVFAAGMTVAYVMIKSLSSKVVRIQKKSSDTF